jgi:hypothetical protein
MIINILHTHYASLLRRRKKSVLLLSYYLNVGSRESTSWFLAPLLFDK